MRYLKAIDVLQLQRLMPYLMQGTQNISREVDISERCPCHGIKGGMWGQILHLLPDAKAQAHGAHLRAEAAPGAWPHSKALAWQGGDSHQQPPQAW